MQHRWTLPAAAPAATPQPDRRACLGTLLGWASAASLANMAGCAGGPASAPGVDAPAAATSAPPALRVMPFSGTTVGASPAGWHPYVIRRDVRHTQYAVVQDGQQRVLHASAASSATGLRCDVQIDPARNSRLRFSWRVQQVPAQGDVAVPEHDDCPARLILAFGGDDTRLPLRDRLFYEQVELFTGNRLPFATLMYVWDGGGGHAVESVHRNHRSSRIQYLTVESGSARAGQWLHYERHVLADYERVFGEAPGPIIGVGVLTDADALKIDLEAWYGDITLAPASG